MTWYAGRITEDGPSVFTHSGETLEEAAKAFFAAFPCEEIAAVHKAGEKEPVSLHGKFTDSRDYEAASRISLREDLDPCVVCSLVITIIRRESIE